MKKVFRRFLIGIGVLGGIYLILALIGPSSYRVERVRDIPASPELIYAQFSNFESWEKWSPWIEKDPTIKNTLEGEDGTVGCIQKWEGDPELSGTGSMEIIELVENEKLGYKLIFDESMESTGELSIDSGGGFSRVSWTNEGDIPFMMRPFALFMSMDDMMGPDFDRGLERIDSIASAKQALKDKIFMNVQTMSFPTSHFIGIRSGQMGIDDIDSSLYASSYGQLAVFAAENGVQAIGMPVSFALEWDTEAGTCELMPAFPIEKKTEATAPVEYKVVDGCKALMIEFYGPYTDLPIPHEQIELYIELNDLEFSGMMEEFVTDPTTVEGPDEVLTKVYYFLK